MEKQKRVHHKALTAQLERKTNHPQTMGLKKEMTVRKKMMRRVQVQKNGGGCSRQPKRI